MRGHGNHSSNQHPSTIRRGHSARIEESRVRNDYGIVTFPARSYSVNGERRSFALLRPVIDATAQDRVRDLILAAYTAEQAVA